MGRLLRRATSPPSPRAADVVRLTVTPLRTMTGSEFTVFVASQLQGISEQEAAGRGDELGGSDPHFKAGVAPAEVAKPIGVDVRLPAPTQSEAADIAARAQQLAALPAAERKAIDEAADWNYQRKVGIPGLARPRDRAGAELWKRSRDEVLRDRNRLDALPSEIRAIVMPGGRRPDGEYLGALRLADRLGAFSWDDWVLFERRMEIPEGDLRAAEKAVDTFTRERTDERTTLERIRGTERLYGLVVRFTAARSQGMRPEQYARFPDYGPMLAELAAAGFRDVSDYERALARYYLLFQRRAGEIARLALANSELAVRSEIDRYSDRLRLAADTPEALGAALLARDRIVLGNIGELGQRIARDPGPALQLDRVRDLTRGELAAEDGSVGHRIVQQHLADIANRERFEGEALVWFSIGLGMLTFGSGTLVVLGSAGELAIGAYQAHDEWERYAAASAAAHSALDPEYSLSGENPSAVWFGLALMGAGFSLAGLGKALAPAKRAIEVLEQTGDVA